MITNERQYRITQGWVKRFAEALEHVDEENAHLHPLLRKAMRDSLQSELDNLQEQLVEYDALRHGRVAEIELDSLLALPDALIQARIAAGLTQKALAQRLGLKEQQVQRYEATRYAGVSLKRIHAVATALGVKIRERVTLPSAVSGKTGSEQTM